MNGTWQGDYTGTNSGQIVVEIDDMGDHFQGCAYTYDSNAGLPSMFAIIRTHDKSNKSKFNASLAPLDPRTGEPTEWANIASLFQGQSVVVPTTAEVEYEWDDKSLKLSW